jgi:hypothetical protein
VVAARLFVCQLLFYVVFDRIMHSLLLNLLQAQIHYSAPTETAHALCSSTFSHKIRVIKIKKLFVLLFLYVFFVIRRHSRNTLFPDE